MPAQAKGQARARLSRVLNACCLVLAAASQEMAGGAVSTTETVPTHCALASPSEAVSVT